MSSAVIGLVRSHAAVALLVAIAIAILAFAASAPRETAFEAPPAKVVGGELYLPGAAHVAGVAGTNWRSDVEIYNVGATAATYQIALLRQNRPNPAPATVSFSLGPHRAVRYGDLLDSLFHVSGSAALRITSGAGSLMANCRTYNQTNQGTYGQFISALDPAHALRVGDRGRLIQLTHSQSDTTGYRTNLGFLNLSATRYNVTVEYSLANGTVLGTGTVTLDPFEFEAVNGAFGNVTAADVSDGFVVVRALNPAALYLAYASVVDNRTGDPIYIPAQVAAAAAPNQTATPTRPGTTATATRTPTRTPTPTATVPAANGNLVPYQPSGWDAPLVASGTTGTHTTGGLVGGATTYIDWAFVNQEQVDTVIPQGEPIVRLYRDGAPLVSWSSSNGNYVLQAGFYQPIEDAALEGNVAIPAGIHTLMMEIDPNHHVSESNENDNTYSISPTWSGRKEYHVTTPIELDAADLPAPRPVAGGHTRHDEAAPAAATKVAGTPIYIMAAAHVAGAGDTQWRTDVEIHNPGNGTAQFEIALLETGQNNSNPQTIVALVAAGRSRRFADILASQFNFTGSAALRITPLDGTVMVTSRTYNLTNNGTFGQFIGGIPATEALTSADEAALIQLSHQNGGTGGARTNLGFVNTGATAIVVVLEAWRADGTVLGSRQWTIPPYGHLQVNRALGLLTAASVADAFGIVSTTTPGGRFLAYASVVDNDTGDPILVPAVRTTAGAPLPPLEVADFMSDWFGSVPGSADFPSLEAAVQDWQASGFGSLLTEIQNADPGIVSVAGNTITADYGSGTTLPDGTVASGSLQISFSNLVNNANRVAFHVSGVAPTFQIGQLSLGIDTAQGDLDLDRTPGGHLAGSLTFSAGSNKRGNSVTGDLDIDTAVCEHYPVGGTITFDYDDETHTIEVPNTCDGTYDYTGPDASPTPTRTGTRPPSPTPTRTGTPPASPTATPGTGDITFRLTWNANPTTDYDLYVTEPNGETIYFSNATSDTGGRLDKDCTCSSGCTTPIENIFWPTGMAPHGTYTYWVDVWSTCGTTGNRSCRLQVLVNGSVVRTHDLALTSGQSDHYTIQY